MQTPERLAGASKLFRNRYHAGELLAQQLSAAHASCASETIVVAILLGGIPVAVSVANHIGCELDVIGCTKLHCGDNEHLTVGAVTSAGLAVIDPSLRKTLGCQIDLKKQRDSGQISALNQERWCRRLLKRPEILSVSGKHVILVDEGSVTGLAASAATWSLRQLQPLSITLALPVVGQQIKEALSRECDLLLAVKVVDTVVELADYFENFDTVEESQLHSVLVPKHAPAVVNNWNPPSISRMNEAADAQKSDHSTSTR